jgi:hypothetical protein
MYNWQEFLNNSNTIFEKSDEVTALTIAKEEKSFQEIEELLGRQIPEDYKSFCKTFGSVSIDEFAVIYSPDFWGHKFMMEVFKDEIDTGNHRISAKNVKIIPAFLDHALWFGTTDRADLLFDLNVPNDSNTSCHVYMLQTAPRKLHFVSDSLFNFITQFCFGNSPNHLPKKISPKHLESHTLHQRVQSCYKEHGISSEEEFKNYLLFKETLDSWMEDNLPNSSNPSTL